MNYQPSSSPLEWLRNLLKRRISDASLAYLGDSDLPGARVDVPGKMGYVYVRFPSGKAPDGYGSRGSLTIARSAGVAFPNYPGCPVYVAFKYNNELEIVSAHYAALDRVGINTSVLNPLNQQSRFVYPWQWTVGLANAVATTLSSSTRITIKAIRHYTGNTFSTFETPTSASMINLASSIPTAGNHRYAALWLDTYTNTITVTTSTSQAMTSPMDNTDIQELVANRPADAIPLKAFYLADAQTTIRQTSRESDLRQHLSTPHIWGFPNVLSHIERVRPNRTLVTGPYTTSGVGAITLLSGAQHIIVHKNNFIATTAPGTGNDSSQGYSIGSMWFNTVTNLLYVALTVGVGTATWDLVASSGGAGAGSFTVTDAVTNVVTDVLTIVHDSTGTPAANFGTGFRIQGESSTTPAQDMARIRSIWTTATHASRVANLILSVWNISTETDVLTLSPTGATIAGDVVITGDTITIQNRTIAASTDAGTEGETCMDDNFLYRCIASNTWARVALDATPW